MFDTKTGLSLVNSQTQQVHSKTFSCAEKSRILPSLHRFSRKSSCASKGLVVADCDWREELEIMRGSSENSNVVNGHSPAVKMILA